jgi:hypothetical protein
MQILETGLTYAEDLNVSRGGAVFVPAGEVGIDLSWLADRVAAASLALYDGLLDLE